MDDDEARWNTLTRQHIEPPMMRILGAIGQMAFVHREGMSNPHTRQLVTKKAAEALDRTDRGLHSARLQEDQISELEAKMLQNAHNHLLREAETASIGGLKDMTSALNIGFAKVHARRIAAELRSHYKHLGTEEKEYERHVTQLIEGAIATVGGLVQKNSAVIDRNFETMRKAVVGMRNTLQATGEGDANTVLMNLAESITERVKTGVILVDPEEKSSRDSYIAFFEAALDDAIQGMERRKFYDLENWSVGIGRA